MGLPLTHLCCVMEMPSEAILEEGYDSDMQFGPFIRYELVEEDFASMYEEEKTFTEVVTEETVRIEEGEDVPVLTSTDINKMKVMELLSALKASGMTTKGPKSVLVSRL